VDRHTAPDFDVMDDVICRADDEQDPVEQEDDVDALISCVVD
jgi:hypothetical protein